MALGTTFGPLTAATGAELDTNFQQVGALTTIQCTATGTNSIVLTPAANQPVVNGYGLPNPLKFGFPAPATTSGSVTLEVGAFGFLPVYLQNGVQATSNTLVSGNYYEVVYTTAALYNSGNGAWVLTAYQPSTGLTALAMASVSGLIIVNDPGTPNTLIQVRIARGCLASAVGAPAFFTSGNFAIDLTTGTVTSTANGMDGESRPASGWVYLYAISTGSGVAGLATTSSPSLGNPTLPAGYAYYGYLGAMWCDGSSNLARISQKGNASQYIVSAAGTTVLPTIASGAVGSPTVPTWTSFSITAFVPATAADIRLVITCSTGSNRAVAAPNTLYGGSTSTTNPPPLSSTAQQPMPVTGSFVLEGSTVAYASEAGGRLQCLGWTDYYSAAGG